MRKIKPFVVAAIAMALAVGTIAFAQEGLAGSEGGATAQSAPGGNEGPGGGGGGGMLHQGNRRARMAQVEREIEANPKLVEDPNYLESHPGLKRMLEKHPEMRAKIEQDPKGFFEQMRSRRGGSGG